MAQGPKQIVKATRYKVQDGDSLQSIASNAGITWQELTKFNWGTDDPDTINRFLREKVGCLRRTRDGNNYIFTSEDDPGIIYIPETLPTISFPTNSTHTIRVSLPDNQTFVAGECYVDFRPKPGWSGEYGFDWMRINGDYDIPVAPNIGAEEFKNIVGHYYITVNPGCLGRMLFQSPSRQILSDGNEYGTDDQFVKDPGLVDQLKRNEYKNSYPEADSVEYSDGTRIENFTSYLSIFVNDTDLPAPRSVEITAQLFVKQPPEEIQFRVINPSLQSKITIDPPSIANPSEQKLQLNITCQEAIDEDAIIKAVSVYRDATGESKEKIVGQLIVVANSKPHRKIKKILMVEVIVPATSDRGELSPISNPVMNPAAQRDFIRKIMNQALIDPEFHNETLDLTTTGSVFTTDFSRFEIRNNALIAYKAGDSSYPDLAGFCYRKLKDKLNSSQYDGDEYIKAFYFNVRVGMIKADGRYGGLNGYQTSDSNHNLFVVITGTSIESTAVHEFLHALGLPHSFDGVKNWFPDQASMPYAYQAKRTENILDYTHHRGTSHYRSRIGLWHWQWRVANSHGQAEV